MSDENGRLIAIGWEFETGEVGMDKLGTARVRKLQLGSVCCV
jgi:hypothetical protein